ncbi:MAG: hypothetical protein ABII97_03445 [Patescibacteria group bacterium]
MFLRIVYLLILVVVAMTAPLPGTLILVSIGVSFFNKFFEGIIVGIFLDSLFFSPVFFSKMNVGFFTVLFILFVFFMEKIKHFVQRDSLISKMMTSVLGFVFLYTLVLILGRFF